MFRARFSAPSRVYSTWRACRGCRPSANRRQTVGNRRHDKPISGVMPAYSPSNADSTTPKPSARSRQAGFAPAPPHGCDAGRPPLWDSVLLTFTWILVIGKRLQESRIFGFGRFAAVGTLRALCCVLVTGRLWESTRVVCVAWRGRVRPGFTSVGHGVRLVVLFRLLDGVWGC